MPNQLDTLSWFRVVPASGASRSFVAPAIHPALPLPAPRRPAAAPAPDAKIYFPNLNALRFLAALLVLVTHIEQLKSAFGIENYMGKVAFFDIAGPQGVVLFFVLSGFLITYLLLAEERQSQTIQVRRFYVRRILRIWPLYLLIVLSSLFVLPHVRFLNWPGYGPEVTQTDLPLKLALYLTFFANLVLSLVAVVPFASQTWSIGTEEQFYLVWPVLLRAVKRHRLALMCGIMLGYYAIRFGLQTRFADALPAKDVVTAFVSGFAIDRMAMGGLFALLLFEKSRFLRVWMNRYVFYAALAVIAWMYVANPSTPAVRYPLYPFLYGIVVLNLAANPGIGWRLETRHTTFLGNISYGLYMLHPLAITLAIVVGLRLGWTSNFFLYPATVAGTIGLAAVSYAWYETPFLRLKARFQIVRSGN